MPLSRISLCLTLACLCTHSQADDLFELSLNDLNNLKVQVASLFEDNAMDVASSVAVIEHKEWENRGALTLGQTLELVPSVFANSTWGGSEVLAIRGYATELSVRGISYSLDGIPLGTYVYANTGYAIPRMPLDLMQRIEMIRGPGSALYGSDAFHGVLSFNLAQSPISQSQAQMSLGNNLQQAKLLNSVIGNQWRVHAGLSYEEDGPYDKTYDYTDPDSGLSESSSRDQSIKNLSAYFKSEYGTLSAAIGKWTAIGFFNQLEAREFQGIGRQFFSPLANVFDVESLSLSSNTDMSDSDTQFALFGMKHEVRLENEIQLKNQIHFWRSEHLWTFDNRGYPDSLTTQGGTTFNCKTNEADATPNPLYCSHIRTQSANEQRLGYQVQVKQQDNHWNTQWILGAGYDDIQVLESRFERRDLNDNLMIGYDNAYEGDHRYLTHALAQGRTSFGDERWLLSYGVRWDNYSDADDHISPRIGLVHKINEHWREKLLYGHAYRAPTALELKGSSSSVLGDPNLEAETIDSYEYVIMYQDTDFTFESVLFNSNWRNAITLVPVATGSSTNQYQNIHASRSQGLELSSTKQYVSWLLRGNLSYVKSKNTSDNIDYQAFPKWMSSLNAEYKFPTMNAMVGIWYRHMEQYALSDNLEFDTKTDQSYDRFDLYGFWKISKNSQFSAQIYNLLDAPVPLPSYYGSEGGWQDLSQQFSVSYKYLF